MFPAGRAQRSCTVCERVIHERQIQCDFFSTRYVRCDLLLSLRCRTYRTMSHRMMPRSCRIVCVTVRVFFSSCPISLPLSSSLQFTHFAIFLEREVQHRLECLFAGIPWVFQVLVDSGVDEAGEVRLREITQMFARAIFDVSSYMSSRAAVHLLFHRRTVREVVPWSRWLKVVLTGGTRP